MKNSDSGTSELQVELEVECGKICNSSHMNKYLKYTIVRWDNIMREYESPSASMVNESNTNFEK